MSEAASLQNDAGKAQSASKVAQAGLLLQRKCACGGSGASSLTGECEACKKTHLQKKLSIGASNDPLEHEADRIADQVMAMSPKDGVSSVPLRIQRFSRQTPGATGFAPASVDRVLAGSGRPLEPGLQQDMGWCFGHDFSQVRVHTGTEAEQSARDVNALAYTVGRNIVLGLGRLAPETQNGRHLIAHELAHVLQQTGPHDAGAGTGGENNRSFPPISRVSPIVARQNAGISDPVRGAQVNCVRRLGGCPNTRPGGIPTPAEISRYNSECRRETGYGGGDVTPTDEECLHGAAMPPKPPKPPRPRSITVLDWGKNWNMFNVAGGLLHIGEIDVTGVRDMVDRIKKSLAPLPQPECIEDLTIIGHGAPGQISVGAGTGATPGRYIGGGTLDPKSPAYNPKLRSTLAELRPLFCKGASVTLRGCDVGDGLVGALFVQRLADLWGVPVRAPQQVIRAGGWWTSGKWTSAKPMPPVASPSHSGGH